MNWIGGSRNRLVMKNDEKRQREFFQKRRMQQRFKTLGLTLPHSPQTSTSCSMDLTTLFIVNQIAIKKNSNVAVFSTGKGSLNTCGNGAMVLPMSPSSPSVLNLGEGKPLQRIHKTTTEKCIASQMLKHPKLPPVLESVFSDNSTSDYQPPITDSFSPLSSTLTFPAGQDLFPLQLNHQQRRWTQSQHSCDLVSPHLPWDTPGLPQPNLSIFTDLNFSSLENCSPVSGCNCLSSTSCEGCYLSSDSNDVREQRQGSQNPTQVSQAVPEQMQTELKHSCSLSLALIDKAVGSDSQGSQTEPQCQCRKTNGETREAETQTTDLVAANTCNASTQCGLAGVSTAASTCFDSSLRPVVYKLQYPSTEGQHCHTFNSTLSTHLPDRLRTLEQEPREERQQVSPMEQRRSHQWPTHR